MMMMIGRMYDHVPTTVATCGVFRCWCRWGVDTTSQKPRKFWVSYSSHQTKSNQIKSDYFIVRPGTDENCTHIRMCFRPIYAYINAWKKTKHEKSREICV